VILFLHNRYRTIGGEERAVEDLRWLVRERLGEDAELLERDSGELARLAAASALLRGGVQPDEVAAAVRRTGARIVHAHNLQPTLGWRALAAAREAGARVVLHLHNYRLVCAVGTCFTHGEDCTRCHARDTVPGVRLACRGSRVEGSVYAAALATWQRRMLAQADHIVVPSAFALERLRALGAPLDATRVSVVPHVVRAIAAQPQFDADGPALVAGRIAVEKGFDVALDACRAAGRALVVAGDGPLREALQARAAGADVRFVGRVDAPELVRLRAASSVALIPSRSAETFGLAAAEAMAAGLPVIASRVGALPELLGDAAPLVAPGDAAGLATALGALPRDGAAARAGLERVREVAAPERVAAALAEVYAAATAA
jgi:glycosyltransferase involved in cell wall biosynthesis